MKPQDVKDYYGSTYAFGEKTDMSPSSLQNWLKWGYVPFISQKKLEKLTEGKLVAEWSDDNG